MILSAGKEDRRALSVFVTFTIFGAHSALFPISPVLSLSLSPPLNANSFRYAHRNASKILCSFCETEVEEEAHFICFCPLHKELRNTSTGICKLNILLRTRRSVTRKTQVRTLHCLYFMPVKNVTFTCY